MNNISSDEEETAGMTISETSPETTEAGVGMTQHRDDDDGDKAPATNPTKSVTWGTTTHSKHDNENDTINNTKTKKNQSRRPLLGRNRYESIDKKNWTNESLRRLKLEEENTTHVILPWIIPYQAWWGFSVAMSILTVFFETYQIAFTPGGEAHPSIFGIIFMAVFTLDIVINFNLAFYNDQEFLVTDRRQIAVAYLKRMFWVDLLGVFPFYTVALAIAGEIGNDNNLTRNLGLLRLLRLVRLYRVKELFDRLQYNTHVSLTAVTLIRNFGAALVWTHIAACVMYFIAREHDFEDDRTWIGGLVYDQSKMERYITALYWSVVTFTTVGYGDFSPVNVGEQVFGMVYMLCNMVLAAWMIGSITLLIVKADEQTSEYRDTLQTLDEYSYSHNFDRRFRRRLKTQAKLFFKNRQIADEEVLKNLPFSVRRKVLRRLYLPSILQTSLMKGIRQQFVDAFLTNCQVEIFAAGEEILQRGCIASDLFLLVEGTVRIVDAFGEEEDLNHSYNSVADMNSSHYDGTSVGESEGDEHNNKSGNKYGSKPHSTNKIGAGNFINDIGFFTETPQTDTIRTKTVCKTLTLSQSAYKMIAEDHPGSIGKLLSNLLHKVEEQADEVGEANMNLTKRLEVLRAGSVFDINPSTFSQASDLSDHDDKDNNDVIGNNETANGGHDSNDDDGSIDIHQAVASIQARSAVVACKDVIKMHIDKLKDDHTTRFLSAAARDCTATISLMCDQGFDPNSADYDKRTALMVSSMKGNTETVKKLLEYQASTDLLDMHGTSALYEAARNGHEETIELLLGYGATLCMSEARAASILCQTVFDGDTASLRRLLKANIDVNAGDYDLRRAAHIACAEGNVVALKVLVEQGGANLWVRDRWGSSPLDEAKRNKCHQLVDYLEAKMAMQEKGDEEKSAE